MPMMLAGSISLSETVRSINGIGRIVTVSVKKMPEMVGMTT